MPQTATLNPDRLTRVQLTVLENLGRYRYLTVGQMLRLGIAGGRSNLNAQLRALRAATPPLLETANFGADPQLGKLESVHALSPAGLKLVAEVLRLPEGQIPQPATGVGFAKDYFHRLYLIDTHIALTRWAEAAGMEVLLFHTYFDRSQGKRAKTRIELKDGAYLVPDAMFLLDTPAGKQLYCLEVYNGYDLGRTMGQLRKHVEALELGSASTAYQHERAARVLCVFRHESLLDSVREKVHTDPLFEHFQNYFLFKPLEELWKDDVSWFETWARPDGRPCGVWER